MGMIGIDLGTTFCAVAALDDHGRPSPVPNRDGSLVTPSAVYFAPDGSAVVGQPALDFALKQPDRVATLIKRKMGLPDYGRPVAGREFRPETLAAIILKKLAQDAATQFGPITGCVITVPASFDESRRKATMDAGRIAGLNVIDIIDDTSAAALAYSLASPIAQTVLVYDLGGGTFDAILVKLGEKRCQVLAIEGDARLGGTDWDDRLASWAAERFHKEYGTNPRRDPQSEAMLQATVEQAKRTLSQAEQANVTVNHAGKQFTASITRAEFETLTRDLLLRTQLATQQVLTQAKLTWAQVDQVLMVGGSTHMPAVQKMLAELTGREPDHSLALDGVLARGAALHAGNASGDFTEINVNAHAMGVQVRQGVEQMNQQLVPRNTQLPASAEEMYYTSRDNQTRVRVRILQGEAKQADACTAVGECWIEGLPAHLPKGAPVRLRCGVAANGRIEVAATDLTSGHALRAAILYPSGLTDHDVNREAIWVRNLRVV